MDRPNGTKLMRLGGGAFLVGLLLFVIGLFANFWPGVLNYRPVSELMGLFAIAGIFLGPIVWVSGKLIHAMSFISGGKDD